MRLSAAAFVLLLSGCGSDRLASAPDTGRFVEAGDVRLFVQEEGPKDGRAVVLVHAAVGWSETWRETMDALSAAGYRAIAVDMPPLGFSEPPRDRDYHTTRQAKRLLSALDAMDVRRFSLVGHSFGCRVAVETALLAPARVETLTLTAAALSLSPEKLGRGARLFFAVRPVRDAVLAATLGNPLLTRRFIRKFIADPAKATDARVAVYQRPMGVRGSVSALGDWLPTLLAAPPGALGSEPEAYKGLRMPALVIWGDADTTTPLSQGKLLKSLLPDSRLVVIPGVGHLVPMEEPARFNAELLAFLGKRGG